jgi:hypothetical protein
MAFVGLPWLEVVAGRDKVETRLLGYDAKFHELRHRELLVCQHEADLAWVPGGDMGLPCTCILCESAVFCREHRCPDEGAGGLQNHAPVEEPDRLATLKA